MLGSATTSYQPRPGAMEKLAAECASLHRRQDQLEAVMTRIAASTARDTASARAETSSEMRKLSGGVRLAVDHVEKEIQELKRVHDEDCALITESYEKLRAWMWAALESLHLSLTETRPPLAVPVQQTPDSAASASSAAPVAQAEWADSERDSSREAEGLLSPLRRSGVSFADEVALSMIGASGPGPSEVSRAQAAGVEETADLRGAGAEVTPLSPPAPPSAELVPEPWPVDPEQASSVVALEPQEIITELPRGATRELEGSSWRGGSTQDFGRVPLVGEEETPLEPDWSEGL